VYLLDEINILFQKGKEKFKDMVAYLTKDIVVGNIFPMENTQPSTSVLKPDFQQQGFEQHYVFLGGNKGFGASRKARRCFTV
jgi:hypothetical protein